VRGMGDNSKTCPEHSRIMVIQRPVLEEPAMEGTSDADPVSLNNSCGLKRRTVICRTCACFFKQFLESKKKNCDLWNLWRKP